MVCVTAAVMSAPALSSAQPRIPIDQLVDQFERAGFVAQLELGTQIVSRQDTRVLGRLERGLRNEDRHARANVAFVFAALGDDRGYRTIADILTDYSERPEGQGQGIPGGRWTSQRQIDADRYYAVHVLGHLKTARSTDLLLPLLTDPTVNYNAAWALGEIGDARAIRPLIGALTDRDALVRVSAIKALEKLRAKEALPHLRALLDDGALPRAGDQISVGETARRAIATLER
jgi:HEAT repeat protein